MAVSCRVRRGMLLPSDEKSLSKIKCVRFWNSTETWLSKFVGSNGRLPPSNTSVLLGMQKPLLIKCPHPNAIISRISRPITKIWSGICESWSRSTIRTELPFSWFYNAPIGKRNKVCIHPLVLNVIIRIAACLIFFRWRLWSQDIYYSAYDMLDYLLRQKFRIHMKLFLRGKFPV